jgi:acyl carrier protein
MPSQPVSDPRGSQFDAAFDRVVAAALGARSAPDDDVDLLEAGLSSLAFVSLLIALEEQFGGSWPVEILRDYSEPTTVGRLRTLTRDEFWHGGQ